MAKILIIDDDEGMTYTLSRLIETEGHHHETAGTLKEGKRKADTDEFDLILLDVQLPDGNGLDMIPPLQQLDYSPEIIIITAYGDPGGAELALKYGVWDYIEKPSGINRMRLPVIRALQYRNEQLPKETRQIDRTGIIGNSPATLRSIHRMQMAAESTANILITGETGTGKELFAGKIHQNSACSGGPFVTVDCTNLPETLFESILFGHAKGAFTGADHEQTGLIKQADGGTLFLDEIGELPRGMQKRFLRVLQEQSYRPVGKKTEEASQFRLIVATNRDLELMVRKGEFRNDLLYRIKTLTLELPPLRKRLQDIPEIVHSHMETLCRKYQLDMKTCSPEFLDLLATHDWPGNVRELLNTIESSFNEAVNSPVLYPNHLPTELRIKIKSASLLNSGLKRDAFPELAPLLEKIKKEYLQNLMKHTGGDIKTACRISGLSRSSLYDQLKRFNINLRQYACDSMKGCR